MHPEYSDLCPKIDPGGSIRPPNSKIYPIPTPHQLVGSGKNGIGAYIAREDMSKLWYIEDLLGQYENYLMFWYHRLNHCTFK